MSKRFNARAIEIDLEQLLEGDLKGVLKEIAEEITGSSNKVKVPLGSISDDLNSRYKKWLSDKQDLEEEIKIKMQIEKSKLERKLAEEFEEVFVLNRREQKKLWKEIRKEMNLDQDNEVDLNIDPKTGVISEWKKADEQIY